uniref:Glyco_tran_10_N domain-containing protein n=1 Tax=Strongyloides papillosus TaxID=174720 RepID=A0A0N5C069_STREA
MFAYSSKALHYVLIFPTLFGTILFSNNVFTQEYVNKFNLTSKLERKRILLYTRYYSTNETELFDKCEPINCEFTQDKKLFSTSDAVVFHFLHMNKSDLPTRAFPLQKFVYFTEEAPFSILPESSPKNYLIGLCLITTNRMFYLNIEVNGLKLTVTMNG